MRNIKKSHFITEQHINSFGITPSMLKNAILYTYDIIDSIDDKLLEKDAPRIAELLELANLSAVIGNLFREGIAKSSSGRFVANGPHKYPDLPSDDPRYPNMEIKVLRRSLFVCVRNGLIDENPWQGGPPTIISGCAA